PAPIEAAEGPRLDQHKVDKERYYLATHGAHLFDVIRFLLGEPTHVTARHVVRGAIHVWHGVIDLASGALVHFELVVSVPAPWSEGLTIYGESGNLSLD